MLRSRAFALLFFFGAAGCGDNQLCTTTCPGVEGAWALDYGDAGTNLCTLELPNVLTLARGGSDLTATVSGLNLHGNVYDTFELTLSGREDDFDAGTALRMRAFFLAGLDAGTLTGTFTAETTRGALTCSEERPFTGMRP